MLIARAFEKIAYSVDKKNTGKYWWQLFSSYHSSKNEIKKVWILLRYNRYMRSHCSSISLNASFASEPILPHGVYGIFISGGATLGENVVIFQGVTIGSNTLNETKSKGAPVIGNNCYIGAGAEIIGGCKIGINARVGANCVVVKDVPDFATCVLANNRVIIHKTARDNSFRYLIDSK